MVLTAVTLLILQNLPMPFFGGMKMAKALNKVLSNFLPLLVFRLMDAELQKFSLISDKEQAG